MQFTFLIEQRFDYYYDKRDFISLIFYSFIHVFLFYKN